MADENQEPNNTEEPEVDETATETSDTGSPEEETDAAEGPDEETAGFARRVMLSASNASVIGQMVVSFPSRDVLMAMDGDAAMRLLRIFRDRSERALEDFLDPHTSNARDAWIVLDAIEEPLAMAWIPGLPNKKPRTAVDPAVVA